MRARTLAPLRELSRQVLDGQTTPNELVEYCLERIEERDQVTEAWACLDSDRARREASRLTGELKTGPPRSDLHGIPFGVKDIFDTAGLATEWGSPLYRGRVPVKDAALVAQLREAGAIVLGKTHTTAFAYFEFSTLVFNIWITQILQCLQISEHRDSMALKLFMETTKTLV